MRKIAVLSFFLAGAFAFSPSPALASEFHGVVPQGPLTAEDFDLMQEANVGTLRLNVRWDKVEPSLTDPHDYTALDNTINSASEHGIRTLIQLGGPGPPGTVHPPTNRTSRNAAGAILADLVARYGPGGTHAPSLPVKAVQVYNEQNGPAYWDARPSPKAYAKLVKAVAKAVDRVNSSIEIVLGGMFGTPGGAGAVDSWKFLAKLYDVNGFKSAYNTVAIHPYSPNLRGIKVQVKKIRAVLKKEGDKRKKLRITEFGWGSASGGHQLNKGLAGQASLLRKAFNLFERSKREWKLKGANWFSWQDGPVGCPFCATSGLVTDETPRVTKPSFDAFKEVAG